MLSLGSPLSGQDDGCIEWNRCRTVQDDQTILCPTKVMQGHGFIWPLASRAQASRLVAYV